MLYSGCSLFSLCLHGDGSSCSLLGLGLAVQGVPPVCLPSRPSCPPTQPWELPALRPPAAHRPCQAGRKKACLLTPSTRLPGHHGSAQKMSGRGHREVGLEPGCLRSRETVPGPLLPCFASQLQTQSGVLGRDGVLKGLWCSPEALFRMLCWNLLEAASVEARP